MSEIHAGSNNFSRGISTSWSDKEHLRRPHGSTISPSWKYLDSSCTKGGPHNYIKRYTCHDINLIGACSSWYDVISAFPKNHERGTAWNTYFPGGYSGFQVTGMIEWGQKSKPKKIPRASKKPKKSLDQKLTPQIPCRIYFQKGLTHKSQVKDIKNSLQQKGIPVRIKPGDKHDGWEISWMNWSLVKYTWDTLRTIV